MEVFYIANLDFSNPYKKSYARNIFANDILKCIYAKFLVDVAGLLFSEIGRDQFGKMCILANLIVDLSQTETAK